MTVQRKHLVLHVEIPGYWADDLDDCAAMYSDPEPPGPRERLDVVTEEWMRETVGITLVSLPGEKCMSDDFEVHAYTGRIVGAETRAVRDKEESMSDIQPDLYIDAMAAEHDDAVRAERERIRPLVARWREAARSLESHNALWSSHFYDCARELERVLGEPPAETNDEFEPSRGAALIAAEIDRLTNDPAPGGEGAETT